MSKKPYTKGMNSAGETPAQVANYLTADLRVLLKDNPELVDKLQSGIVAAIAEATHELERRTSEEYQKHGGWSSLVQCAQAWREICEAADQIKVGWAVGKGDAVDCMKRHFFTKAVAESKKPTAGKGRGK